MLGSAGPRLPPWLLSSGIIALAMGISNLGTYGFTIVAARLLGPSEYGALAAVMALLLIVNVASLGLQATGARRVSAAPGERDRIEADILAATYRSAVAMGLACLLLSPVVAAVLKLDSWLTAALIAATAVPLTIMGGQAGILQGERRWFPLAGVYVALGLGRIGGGTLGLVIGGDPRSAMIGVAVGAVLPVAVGSTALGHHKRPSESTGHLGTGIGVGRSRRVLREFVHNSHALLAFFALSNADVLVARVVLDDHVAGLYAGGLIMAKAVLFLPQFVVVVAFPSMAEGVEGTTKALRALGVVLVIGLSATLGAWVLEGLAVQFIGGAAYAELGSLLWAFAGIGTIWAMTQLLIYNVVAQQNRRAVAVVWTALAALLVLSSSVDSLEQLLVTVAVVEALALAALIFLAVKGAGRSTPASAEVA